MKRLMLVALVAGLLAILPAGTASAQSLRTATPVMKNVTAVQTQDATTGFWDVSVTFAWDKTAGKPKYLESSVMYSPAGFAHLKVPLKGSDLRAGTFTWKFTTPAPCQTCEVSLSSDKGPPPRHREVWHPFPPQPPGPVNPIPDSLWQPSAGSLPASGNYIYLDSDSGDWIGQGQEYLYTPADAEITVSASGGHLSVGVDGDEWWNGDFQTMNTITAFQAGYYPDLERYPFHDPAKGGLNWSGEGRGSNTLTGWFVVDSVTYANGVLSAIDLRFEQHSGGGVPALHGAIHWSAEDPAQPPGPVNPIPDSLWQPSAGSLPATGNYIYLDSDSGDWIGQGQEYLYTPADAEITVSASGGHLSVGVDGDEWWNGDFQTMNTITELQAGYYPDLERYPFHNPAKGGLNWSGEGRGSNTLTGWFVVDSVTYSNGVLSAIDLRFEQHSGGATPALHGAIHWSAEDPAQPPGPVNPIPDTLWQPSAGSLPATGTCVYLDSDTGDYIGQGQEYLYTLANATITVSATGGHLSVRVNGIGGWRGDFQTMNTINEIQAGYYPDLERYPFHNPAKGGLNWSGYGRGSNTLTGWFVVDSVTYANGVLSAIDLRFEQHSEGGVPALHGAIRWSAGGS